MQSKQIEELKEQTKTLFKVVDKLENRISTLEQVIGKLQLRLGDMTWWIDNKLEKKKNVS
jgi:chaperonin cofactor prefoldin